MELFREKKWLPFLVLAFLLMAICLLLWVALRGGETPPEEPGVTLDEEAVWGTAPEETLGVPVETPYLTFYYPEEWRDKVEADELTENGRSITVFRTELSGKTVELFSVILSPGTEDGYLLGQLAGQEGSSVNVYTRVNELPEDEWPQEEYVRLCAMQERVNDIIAQIYENAAFEPY